MTGPQAFRRGRELQHPGNGLGQTAARRGARLAFRRYVLASSGISCTALGVALIVSFFATNLGATPADGSGVRVKVRSDQSSTLVLDPAPSGIAATAAAPAIDVVTAQEPAPAIDLQRAAAKATPTPEAGAPSRGIAPPGATPQPQQAAAAPAAPSAAAVVAVGRIDNVNLTFYDCLDQGFCGTMKYGKEVYEGAAACSWNLPQGTRFRILGDPTSRVYVCEDRGLLEDTWVDIFFHDPEDGWAWQKAVGRYGTIEIVRVP